MIKENSCIKIDYTGYIKDDRRIFDTTVASEAKKGEVYSDKIDYSPAIIIVGKGLVVKGLDESFIGKKEGESYTLELSHEKAFGTKNNKLLRLIPSTYFRKNNIEPFPGMQVYIDNVPGTVRTVSPGRVIVDFNHPLAGKDVIYNVKIVKEIVDDLEIAKFLTESFFGAKNAEITIKNNIVEVKTKKEIPKTLEDAFTKTLKETLKKEYSIKFVV
ncbi:Putative FKBP-type peptidyl-prolyl cis-trans isomerase [Candidatus Tiddalikarchaeum anstoanum]|nr:Putative FKBP-type peptidyl-prolyl cis-trans isomerase [Candidatus Tiddalikarchaeum anstoanum]